MGKGRIAVTFETCIYIYVCVCMYVYTYGPCTINDVIYYLRIFSAIRKVGKTIASIFLVSTTF